MKKRTIVLLALLVTVASISGVYATWDYTSQPDPVANKLALQMEFAPPLSVAQKQFVGDFVEEINDENSALHTYVNQRRIGLTEWINWWDKTTLGSMDEHYSDELAAMFGLDDNNETSFVLKFGYANGNYTSYTLYVTDENLSSYRVGQDVSPVYKVPMVYDSATQKWTAEEAVAGSAPYRGYDTLLPWQSGTPSFNVNSWEAL